MIMKLQLWRKARLQEIKSSDVKQDCKRLKKKNRMPYYGHLDRLQIKATYERQTSVSWLEDRKKKTGFLKRKNLTKNVLEMQYTPLWSADCKM